MIKIGDTVHISTKSIPISNFEVQHISNKTGRIVEVIKTYKFDLNTMTVSYRLDDGKVYDSTNVLFDKILSRDNRLKDIL